MASDQMPEGDLLAFDEFRDRLPDYSEQRIRSALLALGRRPIRPRGNLRATRYPAAWVADVERWLREHAG